MSENKFRPIIERDQCKGCGRCVYSCPTKVLEMGTKLNILGLPCAKYKGNGCVGCGFCFYTCPEPGAITIIEEED